MSDEKRKISHQVLFSGKLIDVLGNSVISNGELVILEAFQVPHVVLIVPILDNGNFLLVEQYRHSIDQATLEFPAGRIEEDEAAKDAARRELMEETGFDSDTIEFLGPIDVAPEFGNAMVSIFMASNLIESALLSPEPYEKINIYEFSEDSLVGMIADSKIRDAKSIAAYTIYSQSIRS